MGKDRIKHENVYIGTVIWTNDIALRFVVGNGTVDCFSDTNQLQN